MLDREWRNNDYDAISFDCESLNKLNRRCQAQDRKYFKSECNRDVA